MLNCSNAGAPITVEFHNGGVISPVQSYFSFSQSDFDVFEAERADAFAVGQFGIALVDDLARGGAVLQPVGDRRHRGERGGIARQALHRAAVRMAADDDVAHAEDRHGIFHRRRHAAGVRREGGTMLPALRQTNRSPGCACMICSGTMRESAPEIISALGNWP